MCSNTKCYGRLAICMMMWSWPFAVMMSSSPIHFMSPHSLNVVDTLAWNYNFNNKKTWKILVLYIIWYHHALACTLNSVVFKLCLCLLFLKSTMVTLYLSGQIVNLIGLKIISNVYVMLLQSATQHMIH